MYIYSKIGPKCGKWDYGGLKMWEVGLWGSKNLGSGTLGSKKSGKWDHQDAVSPPPPPKYNIQHETIINMKKKNSSNKN